MRCCRPGCPRAPGAIARRRHSMRRRVLQRRGRRRKHGVHVGLSPRFEGWVVAALFPAVAVLLGRVRMQEPNRLGTELDRADSSDSSQARGRCNADGTCGHRAASNACGGHCMACPAGILDNPPHLRNSQCSHLWRPLVWLSAQRLASLQTLAAQQLNELTQQRHVAVQWKHTARSAQQHATRSAQQHAAVRLWRVLQLAAPQVQMGHSLHRRELPPLAAEPLEDAPPAVICCRPPLAAQSTSSARARRAVSHGPSAGHPFVHSCLYRDLS